jgi:hypothetical protein
MNKKLIIFYIFCIIFIGSVRIYANGTFESDISDYYKKLIENGELKPLTLLENINMDKYNTIIKYLPDGEIVENYYYKIEISIRLNETTIKFMTPDEYNLYKESPEYKDLEIERIEYAIWHYEAFDRKYNAWVGDPAGKCFSVWYGKSDVFIGKYLWE